jgi:lipoprotein-anchoring transpeptidase ErfK/SrfK
MKRISAVVLAATAWSGLALSVLAPGVLALGVLALGALAPAEARVLNQPAAPDFQVDDTPSFSNFFTNLGQPSGSSPVPRATVGFESNYAPGTIIVNTSERRLYLVQPGGTALRYGIGVGRDGFRWGGVHRITAKKEWPSWTPPSEMLARRPDLPRHMAGGIDNPLGARAMYLGSTLYRIHGSNEPETIGQAVSSGCFRMTNDDVTDLYNRVSVGATVVVKN